jgi:NitT/TauT family transport system ATP-binding protein
VRVSASAETVPILRIEDLSHRYTAGAEFAVQGVSLTVQAGEFVAIVGPSGCGKSTTLSAAAGLVPNYRGTIRVRGEVITGPHPDIGVVFQEDATFPWRNARRNVEFGLQTRGVPRSERRRRALEILDLMGLADYAGHYPAQLSGGMKQRVAIARTLVTEPTLLLMDEPFGALDEQTRMGLGEELLRLQQQIGQTVLFVTHNIQEAILLADRVVVMGTRPGRVVEVIDIEFPRPRDADLFGSPAFSALTAYVWRHLRDEVVRDRTSGAAGRSREATHV